MNGMALCAGIGGLELGLKLALGDDYRCVVYVEPEAYAAATLVARMDDAALDPAPIWDDVLTFDARAWHGAVDLVSAGFPCQPWSVAGKQQGTADERWIWPDIARCVREAEPRWVFLENVPGLIRHGLPLVLADLADLGFDAVWSVVSASDVGAPHRRDRIFILAYRDGEHLRHPEGEIEWSDIPSGFGIARPGMADPASGGIRCGKASRSDGQSSFASESLADSSCRGWESREHHDDAGQPDPVRYGQVGDPDRDGQSRQRRGPDESQIGDNPDRHGGACAGVGQANAGGQRQQARGVAGRTGSNLGRDAGGDRLPLFPPGPGDRDAWQEVIAIDPRLEPAVCRMADGLAHRVDGRVVRPRNDRLRAIGNGVVPVVAAVAFLRLRDRLIGVPS